MLYYLFSMLFLFTHTDKSFVVSAIQLLMNHLQYNVKR